ncbi:prenyltransferase/squalene oxidase repeat-containing protein [Streptomyces sp. NPDC013172]|uniref:prenyltransferase/squalene oxidase repeat-containing protein n=1 Tax=Streptomyces sp. NPDC013172 TaxID=3155009 RepID=UPI0033F94735
MDKLRDGVSESSAILRAVDALHAIPASSPQLAARIAAATARSVARLVATQHDDGGWGQLPDDESDVLSTAQAVPVLARRGAPLSAGWGVTYLLSHQDPDGGFTSVPDQVGPRPLPFDYPVLTDLQTLTALRRARVPAPVARRPPPAEPTGLGRPGRRWSRACAVCCCGRSRPPTSRPGCWSTSGSTASDRRRSPTRPTSRTWWSA